MSMKRKLLKLTFALFATMVCSSVNAQETSGSCGTNATWSFEGGVLTISGTGAITTYSTTMPSAYPWYAHKSDIAVVQIEEGITNVPDWAFAEYGNLTTVSLPSTLKSIGNASLEECAFDKIYLPEGLETIGDYAFQMGQLTAVCIPSTVTSIGTVAFQENENLTSVGCYASTPPTLGDDVFKNCPITDVYVASVDVETYKEDANWSAFADEIKVPSGDCGDNATWIFEMKTRTLIISGTGTISIHSGWDSTELMGNGGAFNPDKEGYPCGIEHVYIGEGITEIGGYAFNMESGIITVVLPSTLTSIGDATFGECFNLATITCNALVPPGIEEYSFDQCDNVTAICVPPTKIATYQTAWAVFDADLFQMPNTKVGDEYWATFYDANKKYEVDANTTIYKASVTEDPKVIITAIEGNNIIPAGTAVILKSTGVPVLTETTTESTGDYSENALQGSDGTIDTDAKRIYCLAYMNDKLAFYKVNGGVPVPAGKAYLHLDAGARGFYDIEEGGTTAIKNIKVGNEDNIYYDLQGRRVLYPKKGLYILNGKKVIIK